MLTLIIYDSTGTIWSSMSVDSAPAGLEKYVFSIPEGAMLDHMDMTDPAHPVPVYSETSPSYDIAQMSSDITDMQIALAELYETITGGNE